MLIEALQCAFAAESVAQEHGQKIDDLVMPETAAGQTHLRTDGRKDALLAQIGDDQRDLPWIRTEISAILVMSTSLLGTLVFFLIKEAYF